MHNKLDWLEYFFLWVLSKDYKLLTLRNRPYCRRPPCFKWWFSFSAVWSWRIHKGKEFLDNCKLKIIRPNIVLLTWRERIKEYQHWRNKIQVTDISKNVCMVLVYFLCRFHGIGTVTWKKKNYVLTLSIWSTVTFPAAVFFV